jgi:hypothetical protein
MATTEIKAIITADDRASKVLSGVGNSIASVGKLATIGLAAAGVAAAAFGAMSVKSFSESEDAAAQLGAVLKSTGGVAGVTAEKANELASSLQNVTKFSDEAILGGENLLLTFTNIGKDIFPQATETMLDMSQALGQDVKSSAVQLGKALQDPILGITALRRVGVNFSDAQKDVVKKLVETGRSAEAQKLILKELQVEFGGSAKAAGSTFSGQLTIAKNNLDDFMEAVGGTIVKGLKPLAEGFNNWFKSMGGAEGILKSISNAWTLLTTGNIQGSIFGMAEDSGIVEAFDAIRNSMIALKDAFIDAWNFLKPSLEELWKTIETQMIPTLKKWWEEILKPLIPVLGVTLVAAIWLVINALNMMIKVSVAVDNAIIGLVNFITVTLPAAIQTASNWVVVKLNWLKDNWTSVIGYIIGAVLTLPIKLPAAMIAAVVGMVRAVAGIDWGNVFSAIWRGSLTIVNMIKDLWVNTWHFIKNIDWGNVIVGFTKSMANGLIGLLEGAINGALSGIPGSPNVRLPRFANGVDNFGGGLAVVGERGAEVVNLPKGSSVIPNHELGGIGGGGSNISINVNVGMYAGSEMEKRKVAEALFEALKDAAGSKNTSVGKMLGI